MTTLAASDSPQLYIPADQPEQPFAWFTMEMLLTWLALLSVVGLALIATVIGALYLTRVEKLRVDELTTDVRAAKADLDALYDNAHWHPEDDEQPPTEPAAVSAGRHAAPEGDQ